MHAKHSHRNLWTIVCCFSKATSALNLTTIHQRSCQQLALWKCDSSTGRTIQVVSLGHIIGQVCWINGKKWYPYRPSEHSSDWFDLQVELLRFSKKSTVVVEMFWLDDSLFKYHFGLECKLKKWTQSVFKKYWMSNCYPTSTQLDINLIFFGIRKA